MHGMLRGAPSARFSHCFLALWLIFFAGQVSGEKTPTPVAHGDKATAKVKRTDEKKEEHFFRESDGCNLSFNRLETLSYKDDPRFISPPVGSDTQCFEKLLSTLDEQIQKTSAALRVRSGQWAAKGEDVKKLTDAELVSLWLRVKFTEGKVDEKQLLIFARELNARPRLAPLYSEFEGSGLLRTRRGHAALVSSLVPKETKLGSTALPEMMSADFQGWLKWAGTQHRMPDVASLDLPILISLRESLLLAMDGHSSNIVSKNRPYLPATRDAGFAVKQEKNWDDFRSSVCNAKHEASVKNISAFLRAYHSMEKPPSHATLPVAAYRQLESLVLLKELSSLIDLVEPTDATEMKTIAELIMNLGSSLPLHESKDPKDVARTLEYKEKQIAPYHKRFKELFALGEMRGDPIHALYTQLKAAGFRGPELEALGQPDPKPEVLLEARAWALAQLAAFPAPRRADTDGPFTDWDALKGPMASVVDGPYSSRHKATLLTYLAVATDPRHIGPFAASEISAALNDIHFGNHTNSNAPDALERWRKPQVAPLRQLLVSLEFMKDAEWNKIPGPTRVKILRLHHEIEKRLSRMLWATPLSLQVFVEDRVKRLGVDLDLLAKILEKADALSDDAFLALIQAPTKSALLIAAQRLGIPHPDLRGFKFDLKKDQDAQAVAFLTAMLGEKQASDRSPAAKVLGAGDPLQAFSDFYRENRIDPVTGAHIAMASEPDARVVRSRLQRYLYELGLPVFHRHPIANFREAGTPDYVAHSRRNIALLSSAERFDGTALEGYLKYWEHRLAELLADRDELEQKRALAQTPGKVAEKEKIEAMLRANEAERLAIAEFLDGRRARLTGNSILKRPGTGYLPWERPNFDWDRDGKVAVAMLIARLPDMPYHELASLRLALKRAQNPKNSDALSVMLRANWHHLAPLWEAIDGGGKGQYYTPKRVEERRLLDAKSKQLQGGIENTYGSVPGDPYRSNYETELLGKHSNAPAFNLTRKVRSSAMNQVATLSEEELYDLAARENERWEDEIESRDTIGEGGIPGHGGTAAELQRRAAFRLALNNRLKNPGKRFDEMRAAILVDGKPENPEAGDFGFRVEEKDGDHIGIRYRELVKREDALGQDALWRHIVRESASGYRDPVYGGGERFPIERRARDLTMLRAALLVGGQRDNVVILFPVDKGLELYLEVVEKVKELPQQEILTANLSIVAPPGSKTTLEAELIRVRGIFNETLKKMGFTPDRFHLLLDKNPTTPDERRLVAIANYLRNIERALHRGKPLHFPAMEGEAKPYLDMLLKLSAAESGAEAAADAPLVDEGNAIWRATYQGPLPLEHQLGLRKLSPAMKKAWASPEGGLRVPEDALVLTHPNDVIVLGSLGRRYHELLKTHADKAAVIGKAEEAARAQVRIELSNLIAAMRNAGVKFSHPAEVLVTVPCHAVEEGKRAAFCAEKKRFRDWLEEKLLDQTTVTEKPERRATFKSPLLARDLALALRATDFSLHAPEDSKTYPEGHSWFGDASLSTEAYAIALTRARACNTLPKAYRDQIAKLGEFRPLMVAARAELCSLPLPAIDQLAHLKTRLDSVKAEHGRTVDISRRMTPAEVEQGYARLRTLLKTPTLEGILRAGDQFDNRYFLLNTVFHMEPWLRRSLVDSLKKRAREVRPEQRDMSIPLTPEEKVMIRQLAKVTRAKTRKSALNPTTPFESEGIELDFQLETEVRRQAAKELHVEFLAERAKTPADKWSKDLLIDFRSHGSFRALLRPTLKPGPEKESKDEFEQRFESSTLIPVAVLASQEFAFRNGAAGHEARDRALIDFLKIEPQLRDGMAQLGTPLFPGLPIANLLSELSKEKEACDALKEKMQKLSEREDEAKQATILRSTATTLEIQIREDKLAIATYERVLSEADREEKIENELNKLKRKEILALKLAPEWEKESREALRARYQKEMTTAKQRLHDNELALGNLRVGVEQTWQKDGAALRKQQEETRLAYQRQGCHLGEQHRQEQLRRRARSLLQNQSKERLKLLEGELVTLKKRLANSRDPKEQDKLQKEIEYFEAPNGLLAKQKGIIDGSATELLDELTDWAMSTIERLDGSNGAATDLLHETLDPETLAKYHAAGDAAAKRKFLVAALAKPEIAPIYQQWSGDREREFGLSPEESLAHLERELAKLRPEDHPDRLPDHCVGDIKSLRDLGIKWSGQRFDFDQAKLFTPPNREWTVVEQGAFWKKLQGLTRCAPVELQHDRELSNLLYFLRLSKAGAKHFALNDHTEVVAGTEPDPAGGFRLTWSFRPATGKVVCQNKVDAIAKKLQENQDMIKKAHEMINWTLGPTAYWIEKGADFVLKEAGLKNPNDKTEFEALWAKRKANVTDMRRLLDELRDECDGIVVKLPEKSVEPGQPRDFIGMMATLRLRHGVETSEYFGVVAEAATRNDALAGGIATAEFVGLLALSYAMPANAGMLGRTVNSAYGASKITFLGSAFNDGLFLAKDVFGEQPWMPKDRPRWVHQLDGQHHSMATFVIAGELGHHLNGTGLFPSQQWAHASGFGLAASIMEEDPRKIFRSGIRAFLYAMPYQDITGPIYNGPFPGLVAGGLMWGTNVYIDYKLAQADAELQLKDLEAAEAIVDGDRLDKMDPEDRKIVEKERAERKRKILDGPQNQLGHSAMFNGYFAVHVANSAAEQRMIKELLNVGTESARPGKATIAEWAKKLEQAQWGYTLRHKIAEWKPRSWILSPLTLITRSLAPQPGMAKLAGLLTKMSPNQFLEFYRDAIGGLRPGNAEKLALLNSVEFGMVFRIPPARLAKWLEEFGFNKPDRLNNMQVGELLREARLQIADKMVEDLKNRIENPGVGGTDRDQRRQERQAILVEFHNYMPELAYEKLPVIAFRDILPGDRKVMVAAMLAGTFGKVPEGRADLLALRKDLEAFLANAIETRGNLERWTADVTLAELAGSYLKTKEKDPRHVAAILSDGLVSPARARKLFGDEAFWRAIDTMKVEDVQRILERYDAEMLGDKPYGPSGQQSERGLQAETQNTLRELDRIYGTGHLQPDPARVPKFRNEPKGPAEDLLHRLAQRYGVRDIATFRRFYPVFVDETHAPKEPAALLKDVMALDQAKRDLAVAEFVKKQSDTQLTANETEAFIRFLEARAKDKPEHNLNQAFFDYLRYLTKTRLDFAAGRLPFDKATELQRRILADVGIVAIDEKSAGHLTLVRNIAASFGLSETALVRTLVGIRQLNPATQISLRGLASEMAIMRKSFLMKESEGGMNMAERHRVPTALFADIRVGELRIGEVEHHYTAVEQVMRQAAQRFNRVMPNVADFAVALRLRKSQNERPDQTLEDAAREYLQTLPKAK